MRRFSIKTLALMWLTAAATSALSIAAHAAVPQSDAPTASLPRPLPVIRRLPPISKPRVAAFSIQEIAAIDSKSVFDDSFDSVFEVPAATPGKPRVGGWVEVGYGAGWTIE